MSKVKRNRFPLPDSPIFSVRGEDVKWPTLRGAYLDDEGVALLRRKAFGVIFLDGMYNTRLNFGRTSSTERAVFFEHLHKVQDSHIFLLVWIGNYHAGSIFHCAWQFPQMEHWNVRDLEWAAYRTYKEVAKVMYRGKKRDEVDAEVVEFLLTPKIPKSAS